VKIKKGDTVLVAIGKDRGRKGKVKKVLPKESKVLVDGLNIYKKNVKAQSKEKPGGIIEVSRPLPVANVVLFCPKCKKTTRIGYVFDKKGMRHRICKKCQEYID
jgi:large subunit ribosomal protein L24